MIGKYSCVYIATKASDVNKAIRCKAKAKDLSFKAKAKKFWP